MKLDLVAVLSPSQNGDKTPINSSANFKKSAKAYSVASSRSSSDHYSLRHGQLAYNGRFRHESYKDNNFNCADQPSNVLCLMVIRPVKGLFADSVEYQKNRLTKKSAVTMMAL